MVGRRESKVERAVCHKALNDLGVPNVKVIHPGGETGWPDRCFFLPGGKPLYIEFKWPGEEPDAKQVYIHKMLRELGYDVEWHDNEAEALAAIRARLDSARISAQSSPVPAKTRRRRAAT